ncbi:dephospho-CoA kinase [Gammaproteobacteria bacterium]|jgi:dephospho-CoA kinase|nr:dephospho-CoA kinase [Gammaproteobacteria bacterium]
MDSGTDKSAPAPLRIGLTGGIASGKSTVAEMFAAHGVPVIDTDVIARQVVMPGEAALAEIREAFGDEVLDSSGALDRAAMRKLIFADQKHRRTLEAIVHPRIQREALRQATEAGGDYQIIVVPLLTGSPLRHQMDRILVVDCDESLQIQRLVARDAESDEQAQRMLAAQASRESRLAIADDVIDNDTSLEATRSQVDALHEMYLQLAKKARANLPEGKR